jgi:hypothetical protein
MATVKQEEGYYVIETGLDTSKRDDFKLETRFEIACHMRNKTLKHGIGMKELLFNDENYIKALEDYGLVKEKMSSESDDKKYKQLEKERKEIGKTLTKLQQQYGLSEYQFHSYIVRMKHRFNDNIDINTAQTIASRAWESISSVLYGEGKKCHFKKHGTETSVEGKDNKSGILFRKKKLVSIGLTKKDKENPNKKQKKIKITKEKYCLVWNGLVIPVKYRKEDTYVQKCLETCIPKYCKIVRRVVKNKVKYYLQITVDGVRPEKEPKNGKKFTPNLDGTVGADPGTQTMAFVSDKRCRLEFLAPKTWEYDKLIHVLSRKLDRSRRACNPDNYNKDGTIKRGVKLYWVRSKSYMKTLFRLKDAYRRRSAYVKQCHEILAKEIMEEGCNIYCEKMSYKGLAKRAEYAEGEEKTEDGKFKRKSRHGKKIGEKAPAQFLTILNRKLGYYGKQINYINTYTYKASQYNHVTGECNKVSLSTRRKKVKGRVVSRDLYSGFLIKHPNEDLKTPNQELCKKNFDNFIKLQADEIARLTRLKRMGAKFPSSMGIK